MLKKFDLRILFFDEQEIFIKNIFKINAYKDTCGYSVNKL